MHVNRKLSMLSAKQTTRRDLFHRQSGATRRLQPVGKSGGEDNHSITNSVIIRSPRSFHSINSTPGNGRVEEKNRAGMTLIFLQTLFHCLDAQFLTGFSRPLLCGIRQGRSIGNTGNFGTASKTHLLRGRAEREWLKHWKTFDV